MKKETNAVKSQIFVRYLISYFRTFEKSTKFNAVWNIFFCFGCPPISMSFCFEALQSTKISSYEPVSSQTYENGYRTKTCDFTVNNVQTDRLQPAVAMPYLMVVPAAMGLSEKLSPATTITSCKSNFVSSFSFQSFSAPWLFLSFKTFRVCRRQVDLSPLPSGVLALV